MAGEERTERVFDFFRDNLRIVVIGIVAILVLAVVSTLVIVYTMGDEGGYTIRNAIPILISLTLAAGGCFGFYLWWRGRYDYEEYDEYE